MLRLEGYVEIQAKHLFMLCLSAYHGNECAKTVAWAALKVSRLCPAFHRWLMYSMTFRQSLCCGGFVKLG
jgi:hypothetical protein